MSPALVSAGSRSALVVASQRPPAVAAAAAAAAAPATTSHHPLVPVAEPSLAHQVRTSGD